MGHRVQELHDGGACVGRDVTSDLGHPGMHRGQPFAHLLVRVLGGEHHQGASVVGVWPPLQVS